MTFTGLIRIFFRWQKWFGTLLLVSIPLALLAGFLIPLKYEAQMMIERKPSSVSIDPLNHEFDMIRLTAETQRNIAVLKSRFMMERWIEAMAIPAESERKKEKRIKKLGKSLTVRPVNFTDMVVLKVKDVSVEKAKDKTLLLAKTYALWDREQTEIQADKLIALLKARMEKVQLDLSRLRSHMKRHKSVQALSLSGSTAESAGETEIEAKEKLYDTLTRELEEAERRIDAKSLERINFVTMPASSSKPVHNRTIYVALALCVGVFAVIVIILAMEWLNPSIKRAGDIFNALPSSQIVVIPHMDDDHSIQNIKNSIPSILQAASDVCREKGSAVIQVAGPGQNEGKTTLCEAIAGALNDAHTKCGILSISNNRETSSARLVPVVSSDGRSLDIQIEEMKSRFQVVLLDLDLHPGSLPGSNLTPYADITCVALSANRTSSKILKIIEWQLKRFSHQRIFLVLNRVEEPLPVWLQG